MIDAHGAIGSNRASKHALMHIPDQRSAWTEAGSIRKVGSVQGGRLPQENHTLPSKVMIT
jgi:hypothetical protein